jgi:hypothetical protein
MSARTTPEGRGSTTSSPPLYPRTSVTPAAALSLAAGTAPAPTEPAPTELEPPGLRPDAEPETESPAETRGALRAARRRRRHVMVGCALVVAVCLVLTLLIVNIARGRRPGSGVVPVVALAVPTQPASRAAPLVTVRSSIVRPDATASEGDNR